MLKDTTQTHLWKQKTSSQHRPLSSFDTEKGKMQITFEQVEVLFLKTSEDYKKSIFSFNTDQIHPIDQIDLHKKIGEMLHLTLKTSTMASSRLQDLVDNIQSQLKLENISSLAKHTKIKSLEDLVIKLGYDPSNLKAIEEVIRRKNKDMATLKKWLKLPSIENPSIKEVGQLKRKRKTCSQLLLNKVDIYKK